MFVSWCGELVVHLTEVWTFMSDIMTFLKILFLWLELWKTMRSISIGMSEYLKFLFKVCIWVSLWNSREMRAETIMMRYRNEWISCGPYTVKARKKWLGTLERKVIKKKKAFQLWHWLVLEAYEGLYIPYKRISTVNFCQLIVIFLSVCILSCQGFLQVVSSASWL